MYRSFTRGALHHRSKTGGWFIADSPHRDARTARVLWDPGHCPAVIPAKAESSTAGSGFRLADLKASIVLVRDRSGIQHVLIRQGAHVLQLAVFGADAMQPVRLLTDLMFDPSTSRDRLEAIARFNRLCVQGRMGPGQLRMEPGAPRLRFVLQALDGFLECLPQREIAERLFGTARVRRDWRHPGGHLRDCVRRAIRRGRTLMESEYRHLLR